MTREVALKALSQCRERIDDVDRRILALLNERAKIVEEIGQAKQVVGMPIYEPKREEEVFQNVSAHNGGPLPSDAVRRVFERIIDEMRAVQKLRMMQAKQAAKPEREP